MFIDLPAHPHGIGWRVQGRKTRASGRDRSTKVAARSGQALLIRVSARTCNFDGEILQELDHLEFRRLVRVLDLLFVSRDPTTGDLIALDYQGPDRGSVVAAILGLDLDSELTPLTSVWPTSESTA